VPLTGTTALCNWPDHPHIGSVQLDKFVYHKARLDKLQAGFGEALGAMEERSMCGGHRPSA
jgi:hypothetical protein